MKLMLRCSYLEAIQKVRHWQNGVSWIPLSHVTLAFFSQIPYPLQTKP